VRDRVQETSEQLVLQGLAVSEGIAIGVVLLIEELTDDHFPVFSISTSQVAEEIGRYRRAVDSSRKDLEKLQYNLVQEGSKEAVTIINTHIQMLEDPIMTTIMEEKIGAMLHNTEHVFRTVIADYEKQFKSIPDEFFRQRFTDVKDLSNRILRHLHPKVNHEIDEVSNTILILDELTPSLTAEHSSILGFITRSGGGTSHAALIARAKGIPYVSNINIDELRPFSGKIAIVDGNEGKVIVDPSDEELARYQDRIVSPKKNEQQYPVRVNTKDGAHADVWANIEDISDIRALHELEIGGIGLLRSEFLSSKNDIESFSEEDQISLYSEIIEKALNLPIYFRVFDVGGDKSFSSITSSESNPALGIRSLRFLLRYKEIFERQIRAILQASCNKELYLLLPLVTDVFELLEAKKIIYQVKDDLLEKGLKIPQSIKIGSMIEIPSAVILSDQLAKESDFFSIGTNDLTQYTLAADRSNSDLYKPAHPSILRMIDVVVKSANQQGIKVSVCGEIASNPLFTPLLFGLGIRHFSSPLRYIPLVKERITQFSSQEAESIAKRALACISADEVTRLLTDSYVRS